MTVVPMLTPNNAVLTTATIEIRTLRLDKRQVTAAVFRQVPEHSPIAANGGLVEGAVPWGLVNYFWPDAPCPQPDGIHLLWQLGNRLHRARLWCPIIGDQALGNCLTGELFMPEPYDPEDLENLWWRLWAGEHAEAEASARYNHYYRELGGTVKLGGDSHAVAASEHGVDEKPAQHVRALMQWRDYSDTPEHCRYTLRRLGVVEPDPTLPAEQWLDQALAAVTASLRNLISHRPPMAEILAAIDQTTQRRRAAGVAIDTYEAKTFPMLADLEQLYIAS